MQDDENGGFPVAFRTAMPPFPADYTGKKYSTHLLFGWVILLEKSALALLGFFKNYFYFLLLFLKVGFNDLTPGISFAPDLSQGDVLHFIPHWPLGSVLQWSKTG